MPEKKISVKGFKCNNCNWEWIPRTYKERPLVCPKCKSARWDKAKKNMKGGKKNESKS